MNFDSGNLHGSGAASIRPEQSLSKLIACLGTANFLREFASHCVLLSQADQVTMFTLEGGRVRHVFAHRPGQDELAAMLCQRYLESFAARDQILATRIRRRALDCATIAVRSVDIADSSYRAGLFTSAGLAGKIALLGTGTGEFLYLNFYYRDLTSNSYFAGAECLGWVGPPLLALLRKHRRLGGELLTEGASANRIVHQLRERMPVLSMREAQVCAAILCGQRLADISRDLGLSHSTVKTFRKRAYDKLSIRRQSGLFARCAGLLTV